MHEIEPYFNWRAFYSAEFDRLSPFYKRKYSEFNFTNQIYNYLIHPQWDEFGSPTLVLKILYVDYTLGFAIIELLGEWNDAISNDIMLLKRHILDILIDLKVNKFILIGENILNFHYDSEDYYDEWYEDIEDGWIVAINFQEHVLREFSQYNLDYFINYGGEFDQFNWRTMDPIQFYKSIESLLQRRLK